MNILLLDNHDSFTWNLVELLRRTGKCTTIVRTPEEFNFSDLEDIDRIVFSPGPGLPAEHPLMAGILYALEEMAGQGRKPIPVLGVCLGMQAMAVHSGGTLLNLPEPSHGRPVKLNLLNPSHPLFRGIPDGSQAGLYHSWAVDPSALPSCFEPLAISSEGILMALAHRTLPFTGVQFHPESIMTPLGHRMVENWMGSNGIID